MPTVIETKKFVLSSVEVNSNKVWQYTLYDDDSILCKWGRVGKGMQSKTFPSGGKPFCEKKIKSKIKKGYKEVELLGDSPSSSSNMSQTNLKVVATKQIKYKKSEVETLISYLTDVNAHQIYDATGGQIVFDTSSGKFQTPLGFVSQKTITEARIILNALSMAIQKDDFTSKKTLKNFNNYLMLIPQEVPRKLTLEGVIPNHNAILTQNSILDGLETSCNNIIQTSNDSPAAKDESLIFDVSLDLTEDGKKIDKIRKLYEKTRNNMHSCKHLKVNKVYDVDINVMHKRFTDKGSVVGNVQELWHGTQASNLLSILKTGFIIPPSNASHCTGRMFGNGIYFSNQSTKSLNYAYGYWSNRRQSRCFMFLCEVAMGRSYVPKSSFRNDIPKDYDSCWAKPSHSGVRNHEMIVYKAYQVNPTFLIEFK